MSRRRLGDLTSVACLAALVVLGAPAQGQVPRTRTDSARAADSSRIRQPVTLPTVRTEAERVERRTFATEPNVGVVSITRGDLAGAPRLFQADVLRAMQLMPGVAARNDYSAGMNVRGGEADQNLILLDGYPIYNPFHFGGLFGTFIDPAVGRIDLFTGAFPARYGGRLSSVLDVRSAEETRRGLHGSSEISLVATTLTLGGTLGAGKGSWLLGGRRTYADKVVDLVKKDGFPYHFADAQAHLSQPLPGGFRLALTGYDGDDDLDLIPDDGGGRQLVSWGNRVLGGTLSWISAAQPRLLGIALGDSALLEQRWSRSRFGLDVSLSGGGFTVKSDVDDARAGGGVTFYGATHTRSIGYEVASQQLSYSTNYPLPLIPAESLEQRTRSVSAYYDELWRASSKLILRLGARYERLRNPRWSTLLPRVSVKYFLNPDMAVTAAVGDYAQWVRSLAREDIPLRAVDYWVGSDSLAPPARARHYVVGLERWLTPSRSIRVEGFYKRYRQLVEPNPYGDARTRGDEFRAVRGTSYGADLLLRQYDGGRFSGWLAYTYVLSSRTQADGLRFFPSQDRRHEVNLVGSWQVPGYVLGARFNLASGTPYTRIVGDFNRRNYDPLLRDYNYGIEPTEQFIAGPRNGERLPLSQRLDVSATRRGKLRGLTVTPYLSVMNVYNAPNVFGYVFDYSEAPPKRISMPQLPVFPTLGLSVEW